MGDASRRDLTTDVTRSDKDSKNPVNPRANHLHIAGWRWAGEGSAFARPIGHLDHTAGARQDAGVC